MTTSPGLFRLASNAPRPLFETAFDAVSDPVIVVDAGLAQLPIVLANAAARREFKRDGAGGLVESSVYSLLPPSSASLVHEVLEGSSDAVARARQGIVWRFTSGDRVVCTELQCLDAAPNQRLLMLTLRAGTHPPVEPAEEAGHGGRAAVAARGLEAAVTDVLSLANAHVWYWDRASDGLEFVVDPTRDAALPLLFPSRSRLLARVHPKDRVRFEALFVHALEDSAPVQIEYRLRLGDGRYRGFVTTVRAVGDGSGSPRGLLAVTQDVTERLAAEGRVRESEALLRTVTAHAADTLVLLGTDLRVRFINAGVRGLSPAQIVGRDVGVILPEPERLVVTERLRRMRRPGESVTLEYEQLDRDRSPRVLELRALRLKGTGTGAGISLTLSDVTERKRLEREILEVSSRERQSIGRDLHDGLGQELTGVALMLRGLATRLQRGAPDLVGYLDEVVALVNQSIETTRGLARGLLPVHAQSGGLPYALQELAARGRQRFGFEIDFRSEIWPELTLDETTASHLYRIAQEALTNAARHAAPTRVEIFLLVTGGNYLLKISDDGPGLSPAQVAEPSGMGLKIMRYRANMIGAELNILPVLPHGTAIQVTGDQPTPRITL